MKNVSLLVPKPKSVIVLPIRDIDFIVNPSIKLFNEAKTEFSVLLSRHRK